MADDEEAVVLACTSLVFCALSVNVNKTTRRAGTRKNNLQLNRTKTREIIFTDKRRKQGVPELSTLPDVARVSSLKMLGVTITNGLSASEHVRNSAKTLHALHAGAHCSEHTACRMKRCR